MKPRFSKNLTRRAVFQLSAAALFDWEPERPARAATSPRLYVQPLGRELAEDDVALVQRALRIMTGMQTHLLPRVELPAVAFYPPRHRYRAERLLDYLDTRLPHDDGTRGMRILGLTGVDISTSKGPYPDWGVVGLGRMGGASCVISAFRCRMKANDPTQVRERLAKAAVHETGHTLGLEHCPTRGCLMEDAGGRVATFDRELDFCGHCRDLLSAAGRPLPPSPELPWSRR